MPGDMWDRNNTGVIDPDAVMLPGVFVTHLVQG
jgi:hypothetical protein